MKMKSLLLGSAAALVAVSGARAADAIVPVEPEPDNYVRVCDVYGSGFYYIPGTETCLSISGYVRYRYAIGENDPFDLGDSDANDFYDEDYASFSQVRANIDLDVREETELGTLRAAVRLRATNGIGYNGGDDVYGGGVGSDAAFGMDEGYMQLGGLTIGYLDTLWTDGDGLTTTTDFAFGDFETNRISYTYADSGFSAAVSLEDDGGSDFGPAVVGRLGYEAGFGSLYVAGVYDNDTDLDQGNRFSTLFDPFIDADGDDEEDAFAVKGGVAVTPFEEAEFKVEGGYATDPTAYMTDGFDGNDSGGFTPYDITLPIEWNIGAGYAQSFGKLGVAVSGTYGETFETTGDLSAFDLGGFSADGGEYYALAADVGYEITTNFSVLGEVAYNNVENDIDFDDDTFDDGDNGFEQTSGFIQFVRSF